MARAVICDNCGRIEDSATMEIVFLLIYPPPQHAGAETRLIPEAWCPECQVSQADTYDVRVGACEWPT